MDSNIGVSIGPGQKHDTVIAEYHSECPRKGNAGVYRNTYITVFGFDGEKIALYKEYLNPTRMTDLA